MTGTAAFAWADRLKAGAIHLGISLLIAAAAAALVFGLWYPYPYHESTGGRELFTILVAVDVVLGPLITLAVFNRSKPRDELVKDLTLVGLVQLAALAYGLWVVLVARPVHLVFEFDRFRVVRAIDVPDDLLGQMPRGLRRLPLTGPTLLAVRPFKDVTEEVSATFMAQQGLPLSTRPDLWQDYAQARQRVLATAKPLAELRQRDAQQQAEVDAAVARSGRSLQQLVYLPMITRKSAWTVLLDAESAEIRGYLSLDPQ